MGPRGPRGDPMGSQGGDPWDPMGGGPMGSHGGNPWDPRVGPWGPIGPWGPLGLGDPLALGGPRVLEPLGLGDPWAFGARALGPVYYIYGSTLVLFIIVCD